MEEEDVVPVFLRIMGSSGSVLTQHRSHIALSVLGNDVTKLPEILKGHLAISEVAEKVGIKNFDVGLSRYDTRTKANFAINSESQLDMELSLLAKSKKTSELVGKSCIFDKWKGRDCIN